MAPSSRCCSTTMAEMAIAVGSLLSYVISKLGDFILSEVGLLGSTRKDLEWVMCELGAMEAILEDVPASEEAMAATAKKWIEDVRELAFRAEDAVDSFFLHADNGTSGICKSFFCWIASPKPKHDFGMQIKQLMSRVQDLENRRMRYGIKIHKDGRADERPPPRRSGLARYVEYDDEGVLGRRVEEVNRLLAPEESGRAVVPIVGMSGLGKTTLAKKIYNNLRSSFHCSAWVDVSFRDKDNFPDLLRRIARDIMNLSPGGEQKMKPGDIQKKLCEFLQSKRYLLVLDDVQEWKTWCKLYSILPDSNNGSRIIVTGRQGVAVNSSVPASIRPRCKQYELPALGAEEGRILFAKKAFPDEDNPQQCCTGELARLGDEIVTKCGGHPLAIIAMGGLISTKNPTSTAWSNVIGKINWDHTANRELHGEILCGEILKLSYKSLRPHLRWCFLFLASLPKACEVPARLLMRLWIAEGFVRTQDEKSLEEVAEMYLEELIRRGLVEVVERASNGGVHVYRVHDLVLDLAVKWAKEIRFADVWRNISTDRDGSLPRRLSITYDRNRGIEHLRLGSNKLRTLVIMDRRDWERRQGEQVEAENNIQWSDIRRNLKLLRVLALGFPIKSLAENVVDMVNLRYLELSGGNITELPSSLGTLRHLQTLDVRRTGVRFLPKSIWQIKTLRYLYGSILSTALPKPGDNPPFDLFMELRALRSVRVDSWMKYIVHKLLYLQELEIRMEWDSGIPGYLCSTIRSLESLNVLIIVRMKSSYGGRITLDMGEIFYRTDSHDELHTLELSDLMVETSNILKLPQNLRQVKLAYARINHGLIELLGKLPSLHLLSLSEVSIVEEKMIFKSGWFPRLHVLGLHSLNIKRWELDGQSLPLLRELEVSRCSGLQALPERLRDISTLSR